MVLFANKHNQQFSSLPGLIRQPRTGLLEFAVLGPRVKPEDDALFKPEDDVLFKARG